MRKAPGNVKPGIVLKNHISKSVQSITILKFSFLGEFVFELESGTVRIFRFFSKKDVGER